jgi:hypothetical protein
VFLVSFCVDGVCYFVTAPGGGLRAVAVGLRVLWEDKVEECRGYFVCVGINLFSFMFRSIMTRIMASSEDLDMLGEFLKGARLVFLTVPLGASMAHVNSLFWSLAAMGRRTLSAGVWVGVRVRGRYRRSVRLQRWAQRQLRDVSGSSLGRSKFKVSFVTQFVRVCCSFCFMLSSLVCFMCKGGWRFLVRMLLVLS